MQLLCCRPPQRIELPTCAASIHLLSLEDGVARLGIEAPGGAVVREEGPPADRPSPPAVRVHRLRNQLNQISLAIHLVRRQWQAGLAADADRTLERTFELLERLERELTSPSEPGAGP